MVWMKLLKTYEITWANRQLHSYKPWLGEKYLTQLLWKLNKWDILKWFIDSSISVCWHCAGCILMGKPRWGSCHQESGETIIIQGNTLKEHYVAPSLGRMDPHWFLRNTEYGRLPLPGWRIRGSASKEKCLWCRKLEFTQGSFHPSLSRRYLWADKIK